MQIVTIHSFRICWRYADGKSSELELEVEGGMQWEKSVLRTLLAALPFTQGWEDKVLTMEKQLMNFLISNNTWKYLEMLSSSSQQLSSFTTRCLALVTKGTYPWWQGQRLLGISQLLSNFKLFCTESICCNKCHFCKIDCFYKIDLIVELFPIVDKNDKMFLCLL